MRIGHASSELPPVLKALLTTLIGPQGSINQGLQGGSRISSRDADLVETSLIEALSSLQEESNFQELLSTTNDYNQTLAHLSILYGYRSLLSRLVDWHINDTIADVNGLTALHCAYMKGDLNSVQILQRGGASGSIMDILGRIPSDLEPETFHATIEGDTEVPPGSVYTPNIGGQVAAGKQFDIRHIGEGDPKNELSDQDLDGVAICSFTGGNGSRSRSGSNQVVSSFKEREIIELLPDTSRERKVSLQTPETLTGATISITPSAFHKAETEEKSKAVDLLQRGILNLTIQSEPEKIKPKTMFSPITGSPFQLSQHSTIDSKELTGPSLPVIPSPVAFSPFTSSPIPSEISQESLSLSTPSLTTSPFSSLVPCGNPYEGLLKQGYPGDSPIALERRDILLRMIANSSYISAREVERLADLVPAGAPPSRRSLQCAWTGCTSRLNRAERLKAHVLTHIGFRPFICDRSCGDPEW